MSNYFKNIIFYKMLRLTHPYFHFIEIYYYFPFSDTFKIIWYLVVVYFLVYICTCFLVMYIYKYIYMPYIARTSTGVDILIWFRFFCSIGSVRCMQQFPTFRLSVVDSVLFVGYMKRIFLTISHLTFG